jgi:hypothetical protein
MQSNRWFWKSWHTSYKLHGYFLAGLLFCALACTWFYYARGYESVISWEKFQEQKVVETTIHEFSVGPFEFLSRLMSTYCSNIFKAVSLGPIVSCHIYLFW